MKISLLDWYLMRTVLPYWGLTTMMTTCTGVLIGVFFEMVQTVLNQNLPILTALHILLLKIPAYFIFTQPVALLLATFLSYTQLLRQSEILALQAVGISQIRLLKPVWMLGFLVTILVLLVGGWVVPETNYQSALLLEKQLGIDRLTKTNQYVFYYELELDRQSEHQIRNLHWLFYAKEFDGQLMQDVTILKSESGKLAKITYSKSAQWDSQTQRWILDQGVHVWITPNKTYKKFKYFTIDFINLSEAPLSLIRSRLRDEREMSLIQLRDYLKIVRQSNDTYRVYGLETAIQKRWAISVSCLILGSLGATITLKTQGRLRQLKVVEFAGLFISGYYILDEITTILAIAGAIPRWLGVWLPNLLIIGTHPFFLKNISPQKASF